MNLLKIWFWLIPLTLLWPGLHLLCFKLRFGAWPSTDAGLVFVPMGLVSAIVFLLLQRRASYRLQSLGIVLGYIAAVYTAFVGSLACGLLLWPIVGTLVCGTVPLFISMLR